MSTTSKGNNNQRIFAKYLQSLGYETEVVRNTKFNHSDYFGIADIIAHNKRSWMVVQVKSNKSQGANKAMSAKTFPLGTSKLVATRFDGVGAKPARWRILDVVGGKVTILYEHGGILKEEE